MYGLKYAEITIRLIWAFRDRGVGGEEIFRIRPEQSWNPPSLLCSAYWACFPGVQRPGRRVDPLVTHALHLVVHGLFWGEMYLTLGIINDVVLPSPL